MTRTIEMVNAEIAEIDGQISMAMATKSRALAEIADVNTAEIDRYHARNRIFRADSDISYYNMRKNVLAKELKQIVSAALPQYTASATLIEAIRTASMLLDDADFPEDGKYHRGTFDPQAGIWLPELTDAYIAWMNHRDALANAIARWQEVYGE